MCVDVCYEFNFNYFKIMQCSNPSKESHEDEEATYNTYVFAMDVLKFIVISIGIVIIFGVHSNQSKPRHIKVIWALLCLIIQARLVLSLGTIIFSGKRESFGGT